MTRTIRLRPWQKAAFDAFVEADSPDFLAVATPGAGKTTFALACARYELGRRPTRLVVVAPTAHLKLQWSNAAAAVGLHLDPAWSPASGLAGDLHGVVTTYQQVASAAGSLRALADGALVILDEIHHAADERAWGDSIRIAFGGAGRRLSLSGTPFRSDTSPIPFIDYVLDEARPDYVYGYGDALRDGRVVRPVYFPRTGGEMEWVAPDGSEMYASFDDALDAARSAQRLRTALSLEGPVAADGAALGPRPSDVDPPARPRRRRPRDRHRPGPRPRHRRHDAVAPARRPGRRDERRPDGVVAHRPVRCRLAAVADRRADGVRGRRHPPPRRRRVRHHDDDRAVLPSGRRSLRAMASWLEAPPGVPLYPRRRPPAGAGVPDRR